jgi:hypothetical protein
MPAEKQKCLQIQPVPRKLQSSFVVQPAVRVSGREVRRYELKYQKLRTGIVLEIGIQREGASDGQRRVRLRNIAGPQRGCCLDDRRRNSSERGGIAVNKHLAISVLKRKRIVGNCEVRVLLVPEVPG